MIGIRADGNNQIGIGHVMRCLTLAEELGRQGENVLFLVADESCEELIRERGFASVVLGTAFDDMEPELERLDDIIEQYGIDRLLIDSYYVTCRYLEELRKKVITVYLDDIDSFPYPVDLLINYNVFATAKDYPYGIEYNGSVKTTGLVKEEITAVLAGPSYAPVRTEFSANRAVIKESVEKILITLGGSDAYNLTTKIARKLLDVTTAELHVVCGPFNLHKEKLYKLADEEKRVYIHENVKEMWMLMKQCDLAVSAAGSTMCELAVAGVPTVTFSFVENQRKIAETFGEEKAAVTVGHYNKEKEDDFLVAIFNDVEHLIRDKECRNKIAYNADRLVDGQGASRIARAIRTYVK